MATNSQESPDCPGQQQLALIEDKESAGNAAGVLSSDLEAQANKEAASKNANEDSDQLHSSEEERTPGGTKQELDTGHSYRIARLSDAQLVVPDLAPTPPNMVTGYNCLVFKGNQRNFNGNGSESA